MAAVIHDVAYDHYGQRVATCSSDQCIRVFDAAGSKLAEWRAHAGSIWRLSWAHPEFGVALASCSFDRKVCVWEENADAEEATPAKVTQWQGVAVIADAQDSVADVQFAPHHLGAALLASCGADGVVRVHEVRSAQPRTRSHAAVTCAPRGRPPDGPPDGPPPLSPRAGARRARPLQVGAALAVRCGHRRLGERRGAAGVRRRRCRRRLLG